MIILSTYKHTHTHTHPHTHTNTHKHTHTHSHRHTHKHTHTYTHTHTHKMYKRMDPGDSTTVVKMCKELDSFLERSPGPTPRGRRGAGGDSTMFTDNDDSSYLNFDFMNRSNNKSRRSLQPLRNEVSHCGHEADTPLMRKVDPPRSKN